jgi:hypothetical protein
LRHVDVVDHHDALVEARRRADHVAHPDPLELVLDLLLGDVRVSLRWEVNGDRLEFVGGGRDFLHEILACDCLACAGNAREEDGVHLFNIPFHELGEIDCVFGRHH